MCWFYFYSCLGFNTSLWSILSSVWDSAGLIVVAIANTLIIIILQTLTVGVVEAHASLARFLGLAKIPKELHPGEAFAFKNVEFKTDLVVSLAVDGKALNQLVGSARTTFKLLFLLLTFLLQSVEVRTKIQHVFGMQANGPCSLFASKEIKGLVKNNFVQSSVREEEFWFVETTHVDWIPNM